MIYSQACSYAIRGLTYLAAVRPEGYILIDELCEASGLPRHFVAKIFQDLVKKGLLISAKGRGGGFALARPAEQVRLNDIVNAIDGESPVKQCIVGMAVCDDATACPQHDYWKKIREEITEFLETTTLADMSRDLKRKYEQLGDAMPQPQSPSKPLPRQSPTSEGG